MQYYNLPKIFLGVINQSKEKFQLVNRYSIPQWICEKVSGCNERLLKKVSCCFLTIRVKEGVKKMHPISFMLHPLTQNYAYDSVGSCHFPFSLGLSNSPFSFLTYVVRPRLSLVDSHCPNLINYATEECYNIIVNF